MCKQQQGPQECYDAGLNAEKNLAYASTTTINKKQTVRCFPAYKGASEQV
jgi:hypothetical protein